MCGLNIRCAIRYQSLEGIAATYAMKVVRQLCDAVAGSARSETL